MKLRNKKTGKVFDALIRERGGGDTYSIIVCDIKAYNQSKSTLDATHSILDEYDSLAELNEEWDDCTPAEPLIKDEKVKKLLSEVVELELAVNELSKRFDEFNKHYVELCGEEEECSDS